MLYYNDRETGGRQMKKTVKIKVTDLAYIALMAVVICICSWISIPGAVPFTMQTFGVFTAVGLLGGMRGTISVLLYLCMGVIGLPVFSGFTGGVGHLLGATGGYIAGFLFSALTMWLMEHFLGKKPWVLLLSMVAGLLVCYLFGTIWFVEVYTAKTGPMGFWAALMACVVPYILPDLIKIGLSFCLCQSLKKIRKTRA